MSSKRGRKRNDNLPPNRARDVQRAFRARRAAHLEALESRVAELEEENAQFRILLNLPPANRAPLGKGPTGKDKPRIFTPPTYEPAAAARAAGAAIDIVPCEAPTPLSHGPASSDGSPSSACGTRTRSLSPDAGTSLSLRPSSSTSQLETSSTSSWDQSMLLETAPTYSPPSSGNPLASIVSQRPGSAYDYPCASPLPVQRPLSAAPNILYATVHHLGPAQPFDARSSYMDTHAYSSFRDDSTYPYHHPFPTDPLLAGSSGAPSQRIDQTYHRRPVTADASAYGGCASTLKGVYSFPSPHPGITSRFTRLTPPRLSEAVMQPPYE